ncbi:MAG TPA: HAMP domain-containing sensor histidine kinase [Anaeromyxobacteraceae bacterium]|nr:HAMP domain-containing sensor histidine kinase [Anaeromyxobacteraceae bacterium]
MHAGSAASDVGSWEGTPAPAAPRRRFSTRRRLVLTFSAVLAAFLASLVLQLAGLRRMEATFAVMKDHEEQMVLALRLEDTSREQYAHALRFVTGEERELAPYEETRARLAEMRRGLAVRLDEPDTAERLERIGEILSELDRLFLDRVVPAARRRDPGAMIALEHGYPLVSLVDQNVDAIIERLKESATTYREGLAVLEGQAARWTTALLLIAPLLVAAATLYLARSVARPLARLSEGAAAVAAGDLDARIDVETADEFGALAAELNAMTAALKQHQRRLVESEKLAGIGRLAAGVAHELNNPLQVMLGYLSLNRDLPDRRLAGQLAAVEAETQRCKDIVEGLLELSRPPAAGVPVDLRALCEGASDRLRLCAPAAARAVTVDGCALALADPLKVGQVVFNLMKNAVEAAGPGGDVSVRIRATRAEAEIAFRDTGPGIAPEVRGRIFEPFFTTKPAGSGLGLAVSRAIARAHGGDIEVGSAERGGAVFTLRLPLAEEARS